jgi:hypothetical protein
MTRKKFVILLLLPLLLIIPLLQVEMPVEFQIAIFILACLFIWAVQLLRLKYLGYTWKQCIMAFFIGALGNTWWKMWQKDPVNRAKRSSSLPSI